MTHKELLLSVCNSESSSEFTKAPFKTGSRNIGSVEVLLMPVNVAQKFIALTPKA